MAIFCQSTGVLLGFMVLLFSVDLPNILLCFYSFTYIFYSRHGCEHGMISIVVAVHSVSADQKEVFYTIGKRTQLIKALISAQICRVGLGDS